MSQDANWIQLNSINHFVHCPRLWYLTVIEGLWEENEYTMTGHVFHESVHDPKSGRKREGVNGTTGLHVWSDRLKIYGICDSVEMIPDPEGVPVSGRSGLWSMYPVEYKSGKKKSEDSDRIQLMAQAACLEEMFNCRIDRGFIFYGKTRDREEVLFDERLRSELISVIGEINKLAESGKVPEIRIKTGCKGCSLVNFCVPSKNRSVSDYMMEGICGNF